MQVGQFPASAATALIEGYCDDFVSLSSILAQTLEQISIRGIKLDRSRESLERIERGMREMSEAIKELLERGQVTTDFELTLGREKKEQSPESPAAAAAPAPRPEVPPEAKNVSQARAPSAPAHPAKAQSAPAPSPAPAVPPKAAAKSPTSPVGPARIAPIAGNPVTGNPPPAPKPANSAPAAPVRPPVSRPSTPPKPPVPNAATPRPQVPTQPAKPAAPVNRPKATPAVNNPQVRTALESLEQERRSGTLYVQAGPETLAFEFVDGCITQTASDGIVADERLGDLLVEGGHCTREKLASVFSRLGADEKHLIGEVLVREGVVANRYVIEALEKQVLRRLQRASNTPNLRFDFADGELMPDDGRVRVSPTAALRAISNG